MRILHVVEAFGGGLMEMICGVAAGSVREGHHVAIAYGRRPETPGSVRELVPPEVELFGLDWGRRTVVEQLAAARALRRLAGRWQPDLIHLHSSLAGAVGGFALRSFAPTIFTPNSFESAIPSGGRARRLAVRRAERWVVRNASLVGAASPSEAEVSRALGAKNVTVVENGVS